MKFKERDNTAEDILSEIDSTCKWKRTNCTFQLFNLFWAAWNQLLKISWQTNEGFLNHLAVEHFKHETERRYLRYEILTQILVLKLKSVKREK